MTDSNPTDIDPIFSDPRLAAIYDAFDPDRTDLLPYILVSTLARREAVLAFKKLLQGGVAHISSPFILAEAEAVLLGKMKLTKQKAKATARLLERQSVVVQPKKIEKVCRAPFDDYILAAAVSGKVNYLVTADKDLLVLKKYKEVDIITSSDFAAIIQKSDQ